MLVRGDTGAGVQGLLHHITDLGLEYSVGVYARQPVLDALAALPRCAWRSAIDVDGDTRDGAQVAEITRYLPETHLGWPAGMRIIARRERPHPGAQLRTHRRRRLADHLLRDQHRAAGGSPSWSCGTGCAPAPRTASAG